MSMPQALIYTDGACFPNSGDGGWAAIVIRNGADTEFLSGSARGVTSDQMEIQGAIEGLRRTSPGEHVTVYSDSQYLIRGITTWIHGWKKRNWMRKEKRNLVPCKNIPHWKALDALVSCRNVTWQWVRGHAGDELNELADRMAFEASGVDRDRLPFWAKKKRARTAQNKPLDIQNKVC